VRVLRRCDDSPQVVWHKKFRLYRRVGPDTPVGIQEWRVGTPQTASHLAVGRVADSRTPAWWPLRATNEAPRLRIRSGSSSWWVTAADISAVRQRGARTRPPHGRAGKPWRLQCRLGADSCPVHQPNRKLPGKWMSRSVRRVLF